MLTFPWHPRHPPVQSRSGTKIPCSTKGEEIMAEPGIFEIIYSTRAMRRLKPDPIPEETLKKIVDAGTRAASGGNAQEWAFVLVRDPDLKRFIRDYYWNTWQQLQAKRIISTAKDRKSTR